MPGAVPVAIRVALLLTGLCAAQVIDVEVPNSVILKACMCIWRLHAHVLTIRLLLAQVIDTAGGDKGNTVSGALSQAQQRMLRSARSHHGDRWNQAGHSGDWRRGQRADVHQRRGGDHGGHARRHLPVAPERCQLFLSTARRSCNVLSMLVCCSVCNGAHRVRAT